MNAEKIKVEVKMMKQWCEENYSNGADTMVECWADSDYEQLLQGHTKRAAWQLLKNLTSIYREQQSDADYYASQG